MIHVLLVDDHEMVRLGVSSYLSMQDDIEVIDEAKNGREGVEKALELKPDIILMDLVMPEMDGIEATKEILEKWPQAKIIILTSFIDDEKVFPAINAGAKSYILKTASASQIAKAIRDTYQGDGVFEPQVTDKLVNRIQMKQQHFLHEDLTQRELEVYLRQTDSNVLFKIEDNGVGFNTEEILPGSYGINNMKERVQGLGGQVKIVSFPNQGTTIEIKIPLSRNMEGE